MSEDAPDPARVVADTDVLAADLLVGGEAREALDLIRSHSWLELIATEQLFDEAESIVSALTAPGLAGDWRERLGQAAVLVEPAAGGHPALVAAHAGEAATILSFDERLQSAAAGAAIRPHLATSVKAPDGFCRLVDPASLYETVIGGDYPGPDRDPRD